MFSSRTSAFGQENSEPGYGENTEHFAPRTIPPSARSPKRSLDRGRPSRRNSAAKSKKRTKKTAAARPGNGGVVREGEE